MASSTTSSSSTQLPPRQTDVIGYHEAFTFGGARLRDNTAHVIQQAPEVGKDILYGMGTNLGTTNLSYREWAFASISALTALGDCTDQLNVYVEGALKHGVEVEEILDLFRHAQGFAGNPRAVNALRATYKALMASREFSLPEAYTESLVRLGDHDTLVRDTHGEGVPIVLIHALSTDSNIFKFLLPELAAATNARVIAYDMRGHGHARGAPLIKSLEHLCADLETLFNTLGIEQADIYGSSFGGSVAEMFALDYPKRVRSLVPIAVGAASPEEVLAARATKAEENGIASCISETMIRWFHPETIAENPWCVRYARRCVERCRVEEWAAACRAMSKLNAIPRLQELRIPVMSLSGTHDKSAVPKVMQDIVDACTNTDAEFVSIERGTHMMVMEQPKPVAQALIAFRRKVDGRTK